MFDRFKSLFTGSSASQTQEVKEIKTAPETKLVPVTEQKQNQPDMKLSLAKGIATGTLCPIVAIPFESIQTNLEANAELKLNRQNIREMLVNSRKAYPFIAATNTARYSFTYLVTPPIAQGFRRLGANEEKSRTYANFTAGGMDGVASGFTNAVRQRYFVDKKGLTVKAAVSPEMRKKSAIAIRYVIPRNAANWGLYSEFVKRFERAAKVDEDPNIASRGIKRVLFGGAAGLFATVVSHPIDAMKTRRIANPDIPLTQILITGYKKHGFDMVRRELYRGASMSFFRTPAALAMNNLASHGAEYLYNQFISNTP